MQDQIKFEVDISYFSCLKRSHIMKKLKKKISSNDTFMYSYVWNTIWIEKRGGYKQKLLLKFLSLLNYSYAVTKPEKK